MTDTQSKYEIGEILEMDLGPALILVRVKRYCMHEGFEVVNVWLDWDFYILTDKNIQLSISKTGIESIPEFLDN